MLYSSEKGQRAVW